MKACTSKRVSQSEKLKVLVLFTVVISMTALKSANGEIVTYGSVRIVPSVDFRETEGQPVYATGALAFVGDRLYLSAGTRFYNQSPQQVEHRLMHIDISTGEIAPTTSDGFGLSVFQVRALTSDAQGTLWAIGSVEKPEDANEHPNPDSDGGTLVFTIDPQTGIATPQFDYRELVSVEQFGAATGAAFFNTPDLHLCAWQSLESFAF